MSAPTTFGTAADFMQGGSRYPKPVAWDSLQVGTRVEGIITDEPEISQQTDVNTRQPRFFVDKDTGEKTPMLQMAVIIQTGKPDQAREGDDGRRTLMIRGGFKYESSKKALSDALKPLGLIVPRVGDFIAMTRIPNRTGAGMTARTHQFACEYVLAENLTEAQTNLAPAPEEGTAPKKRGARKTPAPAPVAAPAAAVTDPWDDSGDE